MMPTETKQEFAWAKTTLSDICSKITDGTHHSPINNTEGSFMYVTAKNIRRWGLDLTDITYVSEAVHNEIYSRCPVEQDDVLYIKDGVTTGIAAINTCSEPFSMLSSVALLKPIKEAIDSRFLKHWLNSPETLKSMTGNMTGSAIKRLILKTIRKAEIELPPLNEQRRIADKLDTTLAAVEACKQKLNNIAETIQRFRQSVLAAAVSGELTREWREERGIEGEWEDVLLSDIADIQGGITKDSKKQLEEYPEHPYLRVANVQRGFLTLDTVTNIRAEPKKADKLILKRNDIFFNEGGDRDKVGRGWIWEEQIENCIFQNHIFRARLRNESNQAKFVSHWSNTVGAAHFLQKGKQTTNLASISKKTLGELPIQLPSAEEQKEIVERIEVLLSKANLLEEQINSALKCINSLVPSILAKAFRGELVPQDPNDEPASVLLERIKAQREAEAATKKPGKRGRKKKADAAVLVFPEGIADNHLSTLR